MQKQDVIIHLWLKFNMTVKLKRRWRQDIGD